MLELSNTSLIVLKRENCILKSRGASLLLLVLLDEAAASEASLHKRYLKMATFKTLQMILFFFIFFTSHNKRGPFYSRNWSPAVHCLTGFCLFSLSLQVPCMNMGIVPLIPWFIWQHCHLMVIMWKRKFTLFLFLRIFIWYGLLI